jgi:hypothetical protein
MKKMKPIKYMSQERAMMQRSKLHKSFSVKASRQRAKRKQIYRLPNGLYVWRK